MYQSPLVPPRCIFVLFLSRVHSALRSRYVQPCKEERSGDELEMRGADGVDI